MVLPERGDAGMLDDSLLEDTARLTATDARGLLRAAALAGAQVRAAGEALAEADLGDLSGFRPRALVFLTRPGVGVGVCRVLAALTGTDSPVPVVVAESLPGWVGALDVVFAHTDDLGDTVLAESVELAARRGASVVLSAPSEGPVAAAGAGRAKVIPPRMPVPGTLAFAHAFAVGLGLLTALELVRTDSEELADELDREAERGQPDYEPLMNQAKSLALRVADRTPALWGVDPLSTAVAEHGAYALGSHAGVPCDTGTVTQGAARPALHRAAASPGSEEDLFADPEELAAQGRTPLRVFVLSTREEVHLEPRERAAVDALRTADLLTPGESVRQDAAVRSAVLATRFDFAAVYLGLAAGTVNDQALPVP